MSRVSQSKAQTEANAKILRALVKQPDNKTCADCKRNDPRWASWNLGCFLCIRCSGIHRSMGTHISKVKSIDLDIWTPEQMAAIQAWGNRRANAYWEAHLKPGHAPPEHKVEAFIRSKYESRRWAKEGPPPADPSVLDGPGAAPAAAPAAAAPPAAAASSSRAAPPKQASAIDLLGGDAPAPAARATTSTSRGSAAALNNFLDDGPPAPAAAKAAAPAAAAAAPKASGGGGGLFDLDWNEPAPSSATSPTAAPSNSKADILSLFSASRPAQPATSPLGATSPASGGSGGGNALGGLTSSFGGLDLGGSSSATSAAPAGANPWAAPAAAPAASNGGGLDSIWGDMTSASSAPAKPSTNAAPQKDDFADIWGDFK